MVIAEINWYRLLPVCMIVGLTSIAPVFASGNSPGCKELQVIGEWEIAVIATTPATLSIELPRHATTLIAATEFGVDVRLESIGIPAADSPIRRSGTQHLILNSGDELRTNLQMIPKDHPRSGSIVRVRAFDMGSPGISEVCRSLIEHTVAADQAYAAGQSTSQGDTERGSASDNFTRAWRAYINAFALAGDGFQPLSKAQFAHSLAALQYQDRQQWVDANDWAALAADLYASSNDLYNRARARALKAAALMEIATLPDSVSADNTVRKESAGQLLAARQLLTQLIAFHYQRGELYDVALQRNNLGLAFYYGGDYAHAEREYRQALTLYKKLSERDRQAQVLQNIALLDWERGRFPASIAGYERALQVVDRNASRKLYAEILNNVAMANYSIGHLDIAWRQYSEALDIFSTLQIPREEARSLYGIAAIYAAVGDFAAAEDFLQQSLGIRSTALDARGRVGSLRALAQVEAQGGRNTLALAHCQEALQIAVDPPVRVKALLQIADLRLHAGDRASAARAIQLAADITGHANEITRADVDLEQSVLEQHAGHWVLARAAAERAERTFQRYGLAARRFEAILALADVDSAEGNSRLALRRLDRAMHLAEAIRAEAANPEFRAGLLQPLRPAFDREVQLLARQYESARDRKDTVTAFRTAVQAISVTEHARARAMADLAMAEFSPPAGRIVRRLTEQRTALLRAFAIRQYQDATHAKQSASEPDQNSLRHQITSIDNEIAAIGNNRAGHSLTGADANGLTSDVSHWKAIMRQLPVNTAFLAYWVTSTETYVWLITPASAEFIDLGQSDNIQLAASKAEKLYRAVRENIPEARIAAGRALADLLVKKVMAALPAEVNRLIIVADKSLHFVPFASLPNPSDPSRFLVERFDIAYAPSIRSVLLSPVKSAHKPANGRILLVADPVYGDDDPRLRSPVDQKTRATPWQDIAGRSPALAQEPSLNEAIALQRMSPLDRLPGTAEEAEAVASQFLKRDVDRLEGLAASRQQILSRNLKQYRFLHFAVHGMSDVSIPQFSSLILSRYNLEGNPIDDRLWAGDLTTRRLSAQTVVFSACDSGLGRPIDGEGLLGLRYVALARGAQSVVASQWDVSDRISATLMKAFYQQLLKERRSADSALAIAMRQLLQTGLRDPALWGAFNVTLAHL